MSNLLILPGDPDFDLALATPPPDWVVKQQCCSEPVNFVMDAQTGIFRTATQEELTEYLYGGEYEEVMGEEFEEMEEWDGLI